MLQNLIKSLTLISVTLFSLQLWAQGYTASFGSSGASAKVSPRTPQQIIEIPVTLDRPLEEAFAILYVVDTPSSARPGQHYDMPTRQVLFTQGQSTSSLIILAKGGENTAFKGKKSLGLIISGGAAGENEITPGSNAAIKATIIYPELELLLTNPSISADKEGDNGDVQTLSFEFTLSQVSEDAVTVDFSKAGGSAGSSDYVLSPATYVIAPGSLGGKVNVLVLGDDKKEETEEAIFTVKATSSGGTGVAVSPSQAKLIIIDDDQVKISAESSEILESKGSKEMTISLNKAHEQDLEVTINYLGGTATKDKDFSVDQTTTLTIPAGSTQTSFSVSVTNDKEQEDDEDVVFELSTNDPEVEVETPSFKLTIIDNDKREVSFDSLTTITDPDSEIKSLSFSAGAEIKRNGPFKYKSTLAEGQVVSIPDPLALSGIANFKIKNLEFTKKWKVKDLVLEFSNFPRPAFPIPGPHIWMQMFIIFHGPYGDVLNNLGNGAYEWRPQLKDVVIVEETNKTIILEVTQNLTSEAGFKQASIRVKLRK